MNYEFILLGEFIIHTIPYEFSGQGSVTMPAQRSAIDESQ